MAQSPQNTSERVIEDHYLCSPESYLIYLMHIATYRYALQYVSGKQVLDLGCGTGYGTALIADQCSAICGVDISNEAIAYATQKYHAPNLTFRTIHKIEDDRLSFPDESFDVILSFQVIEHLSDTSAYLEEIRRLLKPNGIFIVATPDRVTRLLPSQCPWNKFHIKEYSGTELIRLLSTYFPRVQLLHMSGTRSVINSELKRTRRLMWLTLPFTFPLVPEWFRVHGLGLLMRFNNKYFRRAAEAMPSTYGFDESDIHIAEGLAPSLNLIALARKV